MDFNTKYSINRTFHVRNDFFDEGDEIRYRAPVTGGLQRNPTATYLIKGSMELHHDLRPVQTYRASTHRVGAGAILPGEYKAVFLEPSNLRCFHLTFKKDQSVYDIQDKQLTAGETFVVKPSEGIEGLAVMQGEATADDKPIAINTIVEVKDSDIVVKAVTDCTITMGVKISEPSKP